MIEEIRGYFGNISYVFVNQYGEKLKRRKHQKNIQTKRRMLRRSYTV